MILINLFSFAVLSGVGYYSAECTCCLIQEVGENVDKRRETWPTTRPRKLGQVQTAFPTSEVEGQHNLEWRCATSRKYTDSEDWVRTKKVKYH